MTSKDWRNGDIVFANSTCFDEALMTQLGKLAGKMCYTNRNAETTQ